MDVVLIQCATLSLLQAAGVNIIGVNMENSDSAGINAMIPGTLVSHRPTTTLDNIKWSFTMDRKNNKQQSIYVYGSFYFVLMKDN